MTKQYIVYADGACSGNPGPGGWAFEIQTHDGRTFKDSSGRPETTNNIMELTAAAAALEALVDEHPFLLPGEVEMRLDSQYVLDGLFKWLPSWKAKGWKTAGKKPVKNRELWERLDAAFTKLQVAGFTLKPAWVKGHDGEPGNERVDAVAQMQRDRFAAAPKSAVLANHAAAAGIEHVDVPISDFETDYAGGVAQPKVPPQGVPRMPDGTAIGYNNAGFDEPSSPELNKVLAGLSDDIHPTQVELMRTILDLHASGDYSVKKVIQEIRANAVALGCR